MSNTTVDDWLRSLGLLKYINPFLDNGYDDLDICKQIGDEDLDAIGVINAKDRKDILASVQSLKEQGANAVYFQLEAETPINTPKFPVASDREKYRRDELISKMKSLLTEDNCFLPEKKPNVEQDPLNDLAQYYADQLYTYFQDVKDVLLFLRQEGMFTQNDQMRHRSPKLAEKMNSKVLQDSRGLSKSLNSLPTVEKNGQRSKSQKSPKHGLGRLFASKKSKNYPVHSLKISGPAEVGILPTRVHMSEEDRKSLMLQVKHGDITQEEALNNFLKYEAHQAESEEKDEKGAERKDSKKKKGGGIFSRSSFKRRSSGHNSEIMASDIQLCEKDRMELMRKIKNKEITSEEAWDQLRRFGNKRDNKIKSKGSTKGSKSPKTKDSRISASTVQLCNTSTFYTDSNVDISQSTSNIPSSTASDSSPDSTPGLSRKHRVDTDSSETLCSSGSVEFDTNVQVSHHGLSPASSKFPKNDVRRAASEKKRTNKMNEEQNRRSTISNSDLNNVSSGSLSHSQENVNNQPPIPPSKSHHELTSVKHPIGFADPGHFGSAGKSPQIDRKSKPDIITKQHEGGKPVLPPKPALPSKPSKLPPKPMTSKSLPRNAPLLSVANGNLIEDATQDTRTKGEVTSQVLTSRQARKWN
ncbi:uncharacterized protein LOC124443365 [Xenia sp. Carnegie-2017]|uniref:uncharacterized protein LOC124443365 n=1 Tax=Xenia sp. Carnegie-2017 TaxID=2897299 RepID=UPI001F0363C4|nr:uncharacterized protein LOC124443365 [Xenia sp. Carnegie-2017]